MNHKKQIFINLFSFTRCLEIAVHNSTTDSLSFSCYRLINFFFFTYLVIFLKLVNELTHFSECIPYMSKRPFYCTRLRALQSTAKLVSFTAPKRRCSSHTFRYGYLVTT